ncbi:hypothetical protein OK016_01170 [Vibrio chagasii]|nr:hypothetical protein [Vibrio chagasii]
MLIIIDHPDEKNLHNNLNSTYLFMRLTIDGDDSAQRCCCHPFKMTFNRCKMAR